MVLANGQLRLMVHCWQWQDDAPMPKQLPDRLLALIAGWLKPMGVFLIIEFVPKSDEKVKLLLQNREDIFDNYSLENFKLIFTKNYDILKEEQIADTGRILFLMKRN